MEFPLEPTDQLSNQASNPPLSIAVEQKSESPKVVPDIAALLLTPALRIRLFICGVVFPWVCIIAALAGVDSSPDQLWQSGSIEVYGALLLQGTSLWPFLPLFLFSSLAMALTCFFPTVATKLWVRIGIITGIILAIHFLIIVSMVSAIITEITAIFVWPCVFGLSHLAVYFVRRQISILKIMVLTTIVAILVVVAKPLGIFDWLTNSLFFMMVAGPTLNVLAYARLLFAFSYYKKERKERWLLVALPISWLMSYLGMWKLAIDAMLYQYSQLPTTNPNCFVSSAAAKGHRTLVGSINSQLDTIVEANITQQMARLKFLELVLKALAPKLHRVIRYWYDRFGPLLAKLCASNVWIADLTYICLKPIELAAELVRLITRISPATITQLYQRNRD